MQKRPLVSVIVPIYKVEKELEECVDSILAQTYQELEIILVDDGSPDKCGEMCDAYQEKEPRVTAYHKPNGGLSDARNYGTERCHGEYITYVDSDDILKPTFVEELMSLSLKYDAEMVVSPYQKFYNSEELKIEQEETETGFVDTKEALRRLLYQNKVFHTGAHCKLYKREIFAGNIMYPVGFFYEDLATTYRLMMNCKNIAFTSRKLYGYRIRAESIMRLNNYSDKMLSCIPISRQFYSDITAAYPELTKAASSRAFSVNRAIYWQIPSQYKDQRKRVWNEMKKYRKTVVFDGSARKREKCIAMFSYLGRGPMSLLAKSYRKQQMGLK